MPRFQSSWLSNRRNELRTRPLSEYLTLVCALTLIGAGIVVPWVGLDPEWRHWIWTAGLVLTSTRLVVRTLLGIARGQFAADVVAMMAVIAAFLLSQPVVGLVIVLMQSGGEALERLAAGRASNALRALEDAVPRTVHVVSGSRVVDVDADTVAAGQTILVRPGEVVPCDGVVSAGQSHLDTSSLTGEPMPARAVESTRVMSGSVNQEGPLEISVTAIARESQYARIVELVRRAQASRAPLQRVADRYAVYFTPFTLVVCAAAFALSRDWNRVLAILAVATPCPLILATPVAILGGMNRGARSQILFRTGSSLEALGTVTAAVFDKTGTITIGRPRVARVIPLGTHSETEILRLSSAVEQGSGHLLARTVVDEGERRGLTAAAATNVVETPGRGVEGRVDSLTVAVGAGSFIAEMYPRAAGEIERRDAITEEAASLRAYVAIDGELSGMIEYADAIRPGIRELMDDLGTMGMRRIMLLTGDRPHNAKSIAEAAGIGDWRGDMLPGDKVDVVRKLIAAGEGVVMTGDGTNDAPALGAATVGVALASHGRGIATESAGVILLADDPARLVAAIEISRRTMRIARQSIVVGLGLSALGMLFAAAGLLTPMAGALIQEAVDLAVIANALRASREPADRETPREINFVLTDPRPG